MALREIIISFRPQQWSKNLFVFAPLIFSQNIQDFTLVLKSIVAFIVFCMLSGAVYIFNDLKDIEEDKLHPHKSKRPLASGAITTRTAVLAFIWATAHGLGLAFTINMNFVIAAVVYFLIQIAYSLRLKNVVILDVFIIAFGFLIRVVAGALAIKVYISPWLLICTLLLALFLAMSKRRHELVLLAENAHNHRPVLNDYSPALLDQMISVVTASTVVAYCLYTISEETVAKFGTTNLIFTVPFVVYGIFRYLYLVHKKIQGGSPESLILKDKPLLIDLFLWIITAILILYL